MFDRTSGRKVVRYQVVADAGIDRITGRRGRVRRQFKTEREAREELHKLTRQPSTDSPVPAMTLPQGARNDVGAEPLSAPTVTPSHRSRTSHTILALIILFIILLVALGLYAGISGRLTDQSFSRHPDRTGPLFPRRIVATELHPAPPLTRTLAMGLPVAV
ncbi:Arm DNA-binding domain-containing protein [Mycobacterium palustre]|uniref:Arm DNA-binding domain-containing protein n=1 Tax=Mycobacterium palustre TaxID=153971 RepID=UPI001FE2FEAE|nr:Arm DNA-binding domain-containing protein [Mycobacterium palustre]